MEGGGREKGKGIRRERIGEGNEEGEGNGIDRGWERGGIGEGEEEACDTCRW